MKAVIVTGGTSGIGYETALLFANNHYRVVVVGRDTQKSPTHPNIQSHSVDLLSVTAIQDFIEKMKKQESDFSGLIHCAGIVIRKPFLKYSPEDIFKEFQTHVFSTIQLTQGLASSIKDSIVFVNSTLALKPIVDTSIYSAAKAAQASLVKSLALELAPIRVNGIHLGIIDTPIQKFTKQQKQVADTLQILGRIGTSQEAAQEIFHLYHSLWSTGSMQVFDGGISLK